MKFSKTVQHLSEIDKVLGLQYIQYKALKKFLKENENLPDKHVLFVQMVENEHQRVGRIIDCKLSELQLTCSSLITNLRVLEATEKKGQEKTDTLLRMQPSVDQLAEQLACVERFVYYNMEGFRKIVKKHDKRTSLSLSWIEAQRMRTMFIRATSDLESLLVELSDIYKYFSESISGESNTDGVVSDETFERKSYKYWVATEDVFRLKTQIIKHLPLHIFDRKTKSKWKDVRGSKNPLLRVPSRQKLSDMNYQMMGWISSVYLDNDKLESYKARVNMEEGATLFRVRWYANPDDMCKTDSVILPPAPEKGLFFERKTHHESWVVEKSVKERFPISHQDVSSFITGQAEPDSVTRGDKSVALAAEMQKAVTKQSLHPLIRTVYKRASFQNETTNDVRITLDTDLMFVNEKWKILSGGMWKREEEEVERWSDWVEFPFTILEVKLKVAEPQWLMDMLEVPWIRQVHRFSKYQQACATFYPDKVHMFPYWFTEEDIAEVKARKLKENEVKAEDSSILDDVFVNSFDNPAFLFNELARISEKKIVFRDPSAGVVQNKPRKLKTRNSYSLEVQNGNVKKATESPTAAGTKPEKEKNKFATKRIKIEPKTFFANERTMLQWMRMGMTLFTLGGVLWNLAGDEAARISGLVFMCSSGLILLYGVCVYYCRIWMIKNKRGRYDDWFGPAMLTVILFGALATTVYMHYRYANEDPPADETGASQVTRVRPNKISSLSITADRVVPVTGLLPFFVPTSLTEVLDGNKEHLYTCSDRIISELNENGDVISNIEIPGTEASSCRGLVSLVDTPEVIAIITEQNVRGGSLPANRLLLYNITKQQLISEISLRNIIGSTMFGLAIQKTTRGIHQVAPPYNAIFIISHRDGLTGVILTGNNDSNNIPQVAFQMPLLSVHLISMVGDALLIYQSGGIILLYDINANIYKQTWILNGENKSVSGLSATPVNDGKAIQVCLLTSDVLELEYYTLELRNI